MTDREAALWNDIKVQQSSLFIDVFNAFSPTCGSLLRGCIGDIFKYFNYLHTVVQYDLASRVGGDIECPVAGRQRIDVCTSSYIAEVKAEWPTSVSSGVAQLAGYAAVTGKAPASPTVWGAATATGAVSLGPLGTITYKYERDGVWSYRPQFIPSLPLFRTELNGETARSKAVQIYLRLATPLPAAVAGATTAKGLLGSMQASGYGAVTRAMEAYRRYGTQIAQGIALAAAGGIGILVFLYFFTEVTV